MKCGNCADNNNFHSDINQINKGHRLSCNDQRLLNSVARHRRKRQCAICNKFVYFKSLKCDLCNSVAHRRCVNHKINCDVRKDGQLNEKFCRFVDWIVKRVKTSKKSRNVFLEVSPSSDEPKKPLPTFVCHTTAFLNNITPTTNCPIDVMDVDEDDDSAFINSNDQLMYRCGHFGWLPGPLKSTRIDSVQSNASSCIYATWPPSGKHCSLAGSESGFEDASDYDDNDEDIAVRNDDDLVEWRIPYQDLEIGRRLRRGRSHDIYKGRWHGEVMIHVYHVNTDEQSETFWKQVKSMSMIRHENISLFMGICTDIHLGQLAIVTSVRKAQSLYEQIHVEKVHCPLAKKIHIARQVAQGMSYLHAKGIVHRKLNSKNILLENKVKLCLLDEGMAEQQLDRLDYGCIPNGHLTYISPEIIRSIVVQPPKLINNKPYTKESDVYAFGTVLFELFGERWPFEGQISESIIWQVGNGHKPSLHHLRCPNGLKNLINGSWSSDVDCRPTFQCILKIVQDNIVFHRRHSSSEPENLNKIGFNPFT
ncbi:hypothetical protein CHUAL_013646 [Chamberlinius hualienensis]